MVGGRIQVFFWSAENIFDYHLSFEGDSLWRCVSDEIRRFMKTKEEENIFGVCVCVLAPFRIRRSRNNIQIDLPFLLRTRDITKWARLSERTNSEVDSFIERLSKVSHFFALSSKHCYREFSLFHHINAIMAIVYRMRNAAIQPRPSIFIHCVL